MDGGIGGLGRIVNARLHDFAGNADGARPRHINASRGAVEDERIASYRILASVARSIAHVTVFVFPASDSVIGDVGANAAKSK